MDFNQIINIFLAVFTLGTLITAILTIRQTKEFEKERTRPMMQAHLRIPEDFSSSLELVISNVGQTIAHNVTFKFIPDLPELSLEEINASTIGSTWNRNPLDMIRQRLLGDPIQTWVPSYGITVMFWTPNKNGGSDVSVEGIPARSKIEINYTDGYKKPTQYSEVFELNAALLLYTTKPKTPVYRIQKDLQNIHRELKSIREGQGFKEVGVSRTY